MVVGLRGDAGGASMAWRWRRLDQGLPETSALGACVGIAGGAIVAVLRLSKWLIPSGVILAALVGTYAVQRQVFDLYLLIGFGVAGYVLRILGFPLAPVVVGFVLGPVCEINFRRMMLVSQGEVVEHLSGRPIALVVFVLVVMVVVYPLVRAVWVRRRGTVRIAEVAV
ncbi:MAG: tripartite tricarboxylate transporter permease [Rhodoferax sp.]|nr:tripartite tricarboxylate transporter permease [Rhodoferax sp.]MCP5263804.1 tripartite tricarboxylate transporter permease [Rhodoferax sp.]